MEDNKDLEAMGIPKASKESSLIGCYMPVVPASHEAEQKDCLRPEFVACLGNTVRPHFKGKKKKRIQTEISQKKI